MSALRPRAEDKPRRRRLTADGGGKVLNVQCCFHPSFVQVISTRRINTSYFLFPDPVEQTLGI